MGNSVVEDLSELYHLPLSKEAYTQFQEMEELILSLQLTDSHDVWQSLAGDLYFKLSKVYQILVGETHVIPTLIWLWHTCCQLK